MDAAGTRSLTWWRSWPHPDEPRAEGRGHIVDSMPRLLMRDCDYATVENWPDTDFCMVEWDVALGQRHRRRFEQEALVEPERILVAPYDIYPVGGRYTCVHKVAENPLKAGWRRPATPGDPEVHSFGFGCIYWPQAVLRRFLDERNDDQVFNDARFSDWHIRTFGTARITWDVWPQHIHGD